MLDEGGDHVDSHWDSDERYHCNPHDGVSFLIVGTVTEAW